jgi:hypothetical protein
LLAPRGADVHLGEVHGGRDLLLGYGKDAQQLALGSRASRAEVRFPLENQVHDSLPRERGENVHIYQRVLGHVGDGLERQAGCGDISFDLIEIESVDADFGHRRCKPADDRERAGVVPLFRSGR